LDNNYYAETAASNVLQNLAKNSIYILPNPIFWGLSLGLRVGTGTR